MMHGGGKRRKTVVFLVNNPDFFLSHRLPIALAAQQDGYEVHVATPAKGDMATVKSHGFIFHPIRMDRSRGLPWRELRTLLDILRLYRNLRPDIVHHVTIKPVLYGTLAARIAKTPAVVNAVSGMGYAFIGKGWKALLPRLLVPLVYRVALCHPNQKVIFQNPDDRETFLRRGLLRKEEVVIIRGSGVDVELFHPRPETAGIPRVLLVSRMLWDKGVGEFVAAARILRGWGVKAQFTLVGDPDPGNPSSIPTATLEGWKNEGLVEWWGFRRDMAAVFDSGHIVCLPSYREGLPKVLIEAAAAGKPIVTTDVPGCREVVVHGQNGLLVPARDASALAGALRRLVEDPELRIRWGEKGRELAVSQFALRKVVAEHLELYRSLADLKTQVR